MGLLTARPSSSFSVEDPFFLDVKENPDWKTQFGNSHPLKLEIGFGMGDFLVAMARREPESNFIGIDFSKECIQKLLERIHFFQLKNIRVIYGDIREKFSFLFNAEELNEIYINLPDPWPKKRHSKRRLVKPELVTQVAEKLSQGGRVFLATDSPTYANEIFEYFNKEPLLQNKDGVFFERKNLPKSKYEKGFLYGGDKIHYLEYFKSIKNENPPKKETLSPPPSFKNTDEYLIQKFKTAEENAQDACDLKHLADQIAEAGDPAWARNVYQKAEEQAEDCLDLNWLAYSVACLLNDKGWAKKIYRKAEECVETSLDLNWLAYSIFESLKDKDWVKKLFQRAETLPENVRELCDLAESVFELLENKNWQLNIFKKAEENASEFSEYYELADNVFAKLGDENWAGQLYKKAEASAEDFCDLLSLAECYIEKLGDGEGARSIYKKAENKAEDDLDFSCLSESLLDVLGDEVWASSLKH
ncbi:MAG: tRNA (guanosine(46)-N7)-methyltransferase TrmB [Nitrospinota bacterium]